MDANPSPNPSRPGGIIEPNRGPAQPQPGERYELRDPFAEVVYHAKSLDEMITKADRAGAIRFHAIGPNGERTQVMKIQGTWQRADTPEPARAEQPPPRDTNVVALTAKEAAPSQPTPPDAERTQQLRDALTDRYDIRRWSLQVGDVMVGRTDYRYRGDTTRVAFTETARQVVTDTNNPSVARSMVDVAEARRWKALRITGGEEFRRTVWLEASLRGIKAHGYEPTRDELELLQREREARQINRIEPARTSSAGESPAKGSSRGGGRKAVIAALEAVLVARRVPPKTREAVLAAAAENLAQRVRSGQVHKVKVYDRFAPSQRPAPVRAPEPQRTQDRAAPTR